MGPAVTVRLTILFEVDPTDLDKKIASDFLRVVRTNVKDKAEDIRKSATRPRLGKRLVSSIIV